MWGKISLAGLMLVVFAALLPPDAEARGEGYYRWLGEDGTINYSQKPPANRPYVFISTSGGRYLPEDRPDQPQVEQPQAEPPAEERPPRTAQQQLEVLPEQDPEQCQQARQMLEMLGNASVRVRLLDEQGEPRIITPEEREEQQQRAQEAVDLHC